MNAGEVNVSFPREGTAVVEYCGEHDLTTRDETGTLLSRLMTENKLVVVDLCSTTFIDSSFLTCLLAADRNAHEHSHELRIFVCDNPNVDAVLKVTGIDRHLAIFNTREEALAMLART